MRIFWSLPRLADELNVGKTTILKWIERYEDTTAPFPIADVGLAEGEGRITRGWHPKRLPEIIRWRTVDRHTVKEAGRPDRIRPAQTRTEVVAVVEGRTITARVVRIFQGQHAGVYPDITLSGGDDQFIEFYSAAEARQRGAVLRTEMPAAADALTRAATRVEEMAADSDADRVRPT